MELLQELRTQKRLLHLWTEGQATQEIFKHVVRSCRKKIREVKAQVRLNLVASVKDNKNDFINALIAK